MFSILPFALGCQLGVLPVEMWSTIFRYLDSKSLLAGVRSHKLWLDVCHGDPILRQRLRTALKEEKDHLRNMFVNPRMSMNVSRQVPSREYGANVTKSVSRGGLDLSSILTENKPVWSTEKYDSKKRNNKMYSKRRFSPYRI